MNPIILNTQVLIYLLSESILFVLALIAFGVAVQIVMRWDFGAFTQRQFVLERQAYLVMTIIVFVIVMKIILLPYFVFTIDNLAVLVPGAMCAAGVISANDYGLNLLFLKLVLLFFLLLWIALNRYDLDAKNYPIFRQKTWLYLGIFLLFVLELWWDVAYFTHIDIHLPVSCCSALFGQLEGANPLPFGLSRPMLLVLFYLLYVLASVAMLARQPWVVLPVLGLFVAVAYYAVVYFFGTYVYALPTHKCPFCMFQPEYYYVGYLIWGSLFVGTYLGAVAAIEQIGFQKEDRTWAHWSLGLLSFFVLLSTGYVAVYWLQHGVLLEAI
jgi:hypothetical protein